MDEEKRKVNLHQLLVFAKNILRLVKDVWKDKKGLILLTTLFSLVIAIIPFVQSGANALFVDSLIKAASTKVPDQNFIAIVVFMIAVMVLPSFFYLGQGFFQKRFYFYLGEKYELLFLKKRGEIDVSQYEDPKFNNLVNRMNEKGVWVIQNMLNELFYNLQSLIAIMAASAIILNNSWVIFLIILAAEIPNLIVEMKYGRESWFIYGDDINAETRRKYWNIRDYFIRLPLLTELKLFQNLSHFRNTLSGLLKDFYTKHVKNEKKGFSYKAITNIIAQGTFVFIILYYIKAVVAGTMSVGSFLFIIAAVGNFSSSLAGLLTSLGRRYEDHLFIADLFQFLDTKPAITKSGVRTLPAFAPEIVFEDISFSYPGTDKKVYEHFNLTIAPGMKLALIGLNGAGKTTLIKLLCRFYEPTGGRILVDGIDLREIDLEKWYEKLGVLFQEYAHYQVPVMDLISLGKTDIPKNMPRVKSAAEHADASQFIAEWKHAYEQQLGKEFSEGVEPSIGQWQKLALARVFYRDPAVWVLDEPTSSIDADAEAKIFERLEQLPKDKTVILISHRFSTVRNADTICVIDEGRVREIGTHEELMAKDDEYARLFKLQAKGYK